MACGTICRVEIQAIKTQQHCLSQSERLHFPCCPAISAHCGAAARFQIWLNKMCVAFRLGNMIATLCLVVNERKVESYACMLQQ